MKKTIELWDREYQEYYTVEREYLYYVVEVIIYKDGDILVHDYDKCIDNGWCHTVDNSKHRSFNLEELVNFLEECQIWYPKVDDLLYKGLSVLDNGTDCFRLEFHDKLIERAEFVEFDDFTFITSIL